MIVDEIYLISLSIHPQHHCPRLQSIPEPLSVEHIDIFMIKQYYLDIFVKRCPITGRAVRLERI